MSPEEKEIYFNVAISTSLVLFGFDGEKLRVLLRKKKNDPFLGAMLLPAIYVKADESIDSKVKELLYSHTNEEKIYIEQLKAFAKVFRNPLGRVINVAYYGTVKLDEKLLEHSKSRKEEWIEYSKIPDLAFDHNEIIEYAKERLKRRVKRRPIGFYLLPEHFTISQLQKLYETALNREMDKRNFRKKIFNSQLIIETDLTDNSGSRKSAKLFKFDEEKYEKLSLKGYDFLF
ncbi:NUDIX hydrolase [Apibacter sp. HY039]|uniref:NUDIX hydrolase n=1 Tax=Apibacter sp. HY039 TaxID=2501476 RepID=UPI000FEBE37E|nr:NUDIX hydrolase [Apibacter sp. HY039]